MNKNFGDATKEYPCDNCPYGENKDTCVRKVRYITKNGNKVDSLGCKYWTQWYSSSWNNLRRLFGIKD